MIARLCHKYTDLKEDEIKRVIEVANSLQLMANFYESDVFIDVLTLNKNQAVVVAHSKPDNKSLYKNTVVGQMALRENEPGVLKTLETGVPSNDIRALTQEYKFVKQRIHPILEENRVIAVIIVEKDISDVIKENFKQVSSNDLTHIVNNNMFIANHLDDAILIFDCDGKLAVINNTAMHLYRKLGYREDIIGMKYDDLTIDTITFEMLQKMIGNLEKKEVRQVHIGENWFSIHYNFLREGYTGIVEVIKDITELKNKEAESILKTVGLREAHHRVKNNLQTVIALLRRQAKNSDSKEVKDCLSESISRIMTIAVTHDLLSKASQSCIGVIHAITKLTDNIKESFKGTKDVQIHITGEDFKIHGEKATALLLSINEAIQNCYDHAFTTYRGGIIQILLQSEGSYRTIAIVDNGVGFDMNSTKQDSLGMYIIKSYVTDLLHGTLDIESNERGTKVIIRFRDN